MNEFDIEYLESVCRCDNRYEEWLERHQHESMGYDVPHPSIVWTEATMLIMVLRDVNFDKQYVFKTWNNGKSDVEAYFVKSTTMYLIMHGDNRILNISSRDEERFIRDINDYEFFGKLKRKRRSRINEENGKYLEIDDSKSMMMLAEPSVKCRDLTIPDKKMMRSTIGNLIRMCPKNDMKGITTSMSLVAYYNEVMQGGLRDEVHQLRDMMNQCIDRSTSNDSPLDLKCQFSDEQVRTSGISKEAKIVLAVIDYMINGDYRNNIAFDCDIHDFNVALYSAMKTLGYWERTREDFKRMMKRMFNISVKVGLMSRYFQRNSDNYRNWSTYSNSKLENRYKIAKDFEVCIERVKKYKSNNF